MDKTPENKNLAHRAISDFANNNPERKPLTSAHARLHSNLFSVSRAVNPLVAAGAPILTLITHIQSLNDAPNLGQLHDQLSHEICVFESKAQSLGYHAQVVLAARYILCTMIDESIEETNWGEEFNWREHSILQAFQGENWGGERCFYILERSTEEPRRYLELLELGYLMISMGLQGKYRNTSNGHKQLNEFMETLFRIITHERGEASKQLLIAAPSKQKDDTVTRSKVRLPSIWITLLVTIAVLCGIYLPYRIHLQQLSSPLSNTLTHLQTKSTHES